VGAEVAAALDSAHMRTDDAGVPLGIVNRDVNPARIRLDPHGQVKLMDFGVALSRLAGRLATSLPRPQGEVLYAAPEVLLGEVVDARADLFSLPCRSGTSSTLCCGAIPPSASPRPPNWSTS
jgi:serine/threonine-protein kinase